MKPVCPSRAWVMGNGMPFSDRMGSVKTCGLRVVGKHCILTPKGAHSASSPVLPKLLAFLNMAVIAGKGVSATTLPTMCSAFRMSTLLCNRKPFFHNNRGRPGRLSGTASSGCCAKAPARASSRPSLLNITTAEIPLLRIAGTTTRFSASRAAPSPACSLTRCN